MDSKSGLSRDGCGRMLRFHPEAADDDEQGEKDGAESEDVTDADAVGDEAGEDEAGDLRGKDEAHEG